MNKCITQKNKSDYINKHNHNYAHTNEPNLIF